MSDITTKHLKTPNIEKNSTNNTVNEHDNSTTLDAATKALEYHSMPYGGKLGVSITKPLKSREDFGYAYTPGVAVPCLEINKDIFKAFKYTNKWNTIAIISNGTAVLGLGDIGALAGKPVMEGKAALMKYLAGIDGLDLEINEKDPQKLIQIIEAVSCTFGGINLEDVSAPACFVIDEALTESLGMPFCHDDQHGTAIVVNAAICNALELVNKKIADVKMVFNGAGAAAIACANLLVHAGAKRENIYMFDSSGILHTDRKLDQYKAQYAQTSSISLQEALNGADIFIGLSVANALSESDIADMNDKPIVFAMANPTPEIFPTIVKKTKPNAVAGSGRSDFPNQVNNVLCFPFLFRGALDVLATKITMNMKLACAKAIMQTAKEHKDFDTDHVIPDAFDPILLYKASRAVALAAIEDKVNTQSLPDNYDQFLDTLVYGYSFDATAIGVPQDGHLQADTNEKHSTGSNNYVTLCRILSHHGVKNHIAKKMHIMSQEELLTHINEITNGIFVFKNINIAYKCNADGLKCNDISEIKKLLENNEFIGVIGQNDLYFNNTNRVWYAHKLCQLNLQNVKPFKESV